MKRLGILTDRLRALVRRDAVIEEISDRPAGAASRSTLEQYSHRCTG